MVQFPPELRAAFGLDALDMATVLGFYGFVFLFVQLCLAIQAGNYGFGLVSIEESELTADFLLSKPVSRAQILTSKLLAALTSLLVTLWSSGPARSSAIALFRGGRSYDPATLRLLLSQRPDLPALLPGRWPGDLPAGQARAQRDALLARPRLRHLRVGAFSGLFGDVKLELITPFKHFDPSYIVRQGAYDIATGAAQCRDHPGVVGGQLLALHPPRHPGGVVRRRDEHLPS